MATSSIVRDCKIVSFSLSDQVNLTVKDAFGSNYRATPIPAGKDVGMIYLDGGNESKYPYEYVVGEWFIKNQEIMVMIFSSRVK